MHYSTLLLAATAAASATILPRQSNGQFAITNLDFAGNPGSSIITHRFQASVNEFDGRETGICDVEADLEKPTLALSNTTCQDPTWSFSFLPDAPAQSGFEWTFKISHNAGQGVETACVFYPNSSIEQVYDSERRTIVPVLNAEENFYVSYNAGTDC